MGARVLFINAWLTRVSGLGLGLRELLTALEVILPTN